MGLFNWLKEIAENRIRAEEDAKKAVISNAANGIISLSLTCRKCKNLAIPILGTESNYICIECSNRFTGTKHRLGQSLERQRYDDGSSTSTFVYNYMNYDSAVNYIKENYKN